MTDLNSKRPSTGPSLMRRQDAKKNLASGRDGEHSPAQMAEA